jgi:hypothetical protein
MRNKYVFGLVLVLFIAIGCEDFFEKDLSRSHILLISPPDNLQSTLIAQTFWWETVDGALEYNIQIVSPSFGYVEKLYLDSIIPINKFMFSLLPGKYEWRVKGMNNSSETLWTIYRLTIDSTNDISHQIIQLLSPGDHDTTNKSSFLFQWEKLYNADNYNFQCIYNGSIVFDKDISDDTITFSPGNGDGSYVWQVRGQNSSSNTQYSFRNLFIDTEPPYAPQLIEPGNNVVVPDSIILFSWTRGSSTGSSVKDSLMIAQDSTFTEIVASVFQSETDYSDSLGSGTFFWKVKSIDKAGNQSNFSSLRKLIVQ